MRKMPIVTFSFILGPKVYFIFLLFQGLKYNVLKVLGLTTLVGETPKEITVVLLTEQGSSLI